MPAQQAPPGTTPPNQVSDVIEQIGREGPNFAVIAPLIGLVVTFVGICLGIAMLGGFANLGIGTARWGLQGGNEKGAAAAKKNLSHGGVVILVIALIGFIASTVALVIRAF